MNQADVERVAADPDASTTVEEMRQFHRTAGPESLLAFQYALHALATPISEYFVAYGPREVSEWIEERHEGCRSCTCPIRSIGQCGSAACERWITSVNEEPPAYCCKRCATRAAHARTRDFDERIIEIVHNYPDGIEVDLIANHLKVDRQRVRGAATRLAKRKPPQIEERYERMPGAGYATTWYLVPAYNNAAKDGES